MEILSIGVSVLTLKNLEIIGADTDLLNEIYDYIMYNSNVPKDSRVVISRLVDNSVKVELFNPILSVCLDSAEFHGVKNVFFVLTKEGLTFKVGTLLLQGEYSEDFDAVEYFNMSIEMETGECFSAYDITEDDIEPATPEQAKKVINYLDNLYSL